MDNRAPGSAIVANGPFVGGGMKIAPAADPGDGLLDVVVLGDIGRLETLRWLPRVYRGTHVMHPRVVTGRTVSCRIVAGPTCPVHVDGEAFGAGPVTIAVRAGGLVVRR
jgi:diacylglycerol kinase (ATP)